MSCPNGEGVLEGDWEGECECEWEEGYVLLTICGLSF